MVSFGVWGRGEPSALRRDTKHDDNRKLANTIVAQITTNLARAGDKSHVLIQVASTEGKQTGLLHDSVISCNNLATINESKIQFLIGRLGPCTLQEVNDSLKAAL